MATYSIHSAARERSIARSVLSRFALLGAALSLAAFVAQDAQARPGGGGARGGGSIGAARGGGIGQGIGARSGSRQFPGTGSAQRPTGQARQDTVNAGNRSASAKGAAANSGNTGVAGNRTGNTGVANSGNGNGNTGVVNNGNVNNGNIGSGNVNTGNVAVGNDVDVNVENNGGWGSYPYGSGAAYATGVAVGATTTAVAVGSTYSALPASCYPYAWNGASYYSCSGTWYQQRYAGTSVTYVVVSDPTKK